MSHTLLLLLSTAMTSVLKTDGGMDTWYPLYYKHSRTRSWASNPHSSSIILWATERRQTWATARSLTNAQGLHKQPGRKWKKERKRERKPALLFLPPPPLQWWEAARWRKQRKGSGDSVLFQLCVLWRARTHTLIASIKATLSSSSGISLLILGQR